MTTQFPGNVTHVNRTVAGLRNLNTVIGVQVFDDGNVLASLDANWTSPQLRRLGVAEAWLRMRLSLWERQAIVDMARPLLPTMDEDAHVLRLDLPAEYITAEDGDKHLVLDMINLVTRYQRRQADLLPNIAVITSVEQVLARVAPEWLAARRYMAGMTQLMGE